MLIVRHLKKWIKYISMKWQMIFKPKVTELQNSRSPKYLTRGRNSLKELIYRLVIKPVVILWKNIIKYSRDSLHL